MQTQRTSVVLIRTALVFGLIAGCGDADPTPIDDSDPIEPGAAELIAQPSVLDFGVVSERVEAQGTVRIINVGTEPADITDLFIAGSGDFELAGQSVSLVPFTLGVYDAAAREPELRVEIRYRPTAPGADEAVLVVRSDSAGGLTVNVDIVGEVVAGRLYCSPNPIDLGPTPVGAMSRAIVVCTNGSAEVVNLRRIALEPVSEQIGLDGVPSELLEEDGFVTLLPDTDFSFEVLFNPQSVVVTSSLLVIDYAIGGTDDQVTMLTSGIGIE